MGIITVVNKYKEPDHIYCGRGSALGNPFYMRDESKRDEVCDKYEHWFYDHVDEPRFLDCPGDYEIVLNPQMIQLRTIFHAAQEGDVNLGCFCAPFRCHCDTIKHFIELKLEELMK